MKVFFVCGTWQSGLGLFKEISKGLREDVETVLIPSPAKYGDGMAYVESVAATEKNIFNQLSEETEPYFLVAYSQGAHAAGNIVRDFGKRGLPNLGKYFGIADPMRSPRDFTAGPVVGGSGIMGAREVGRRCVNIVAPGDIVAANTNPFIRNAARYSTSVSVTNPKLWVKSLIPAAKAHEDGGSFRDAVKEIGSYLTTQVHIRYGSYEVEPGLTVPNYIIREVEALERRFISAS